MEKINSADDVIFLFDTFNEDSEKLYSSFLLSGKRYPALVFEENGFLPDGVTSFFGYYMGDYREAKDYLGRPRYFNQVEVPDLWEIRSTNSGGNIYDLYQERGRIFYREPRNRRQVSIIDWLDDKGVVRASDHYNKYGSIYARTVFNKKGRKVNRSYFDGKGREVVQENYVTKDIILNDGDVVRIFNNRTEFALFTIRRMGYENSALYYNSLSFPFFTSERLPDNGGRDILFWQEKINKNMPGNMRIIVDEQSVRTGRIMVQRRDSYDKLMAETGHNNIFTQLGYVYEFKRQPYWGNDALICTNSDNIEKLTELVQGMPEMTFHIAALTEMSSKLLDMGRYDNVRLYPGAGVNKVDELFDMCNYYLDINHESEILAAVKKAFLSNLVIMGFEETVHNREVIAEDYLYPAAKVEDMINDLRKIVNDRHLYLSYIDVQHEKAMSLKSYEGTV
ncbi:MAG: accessory Sec system glycosylation chaperone GtfB [Lachnospiraceae bacterium]|nr:accessory Sec system glycosylation chaperone GtfB [Lachnospiraceae bacterium]